MGGAVRVTVIGAGVIGLTCALRLREAGHVVTVVARDLPLDTTSAVAAALWYPYLALPRDRVTTWSAVSYGTFARVAAETPECGVRMLPGRELFRGTEPEPWWATAVPTLRRLNANELPNGFTDGRTFLAPTIDMPRYLGWLVGRLGTDGVDLVQRVVEDLDAETRAADVVVVCAGLGAVDLLGDTEMVPIRGQVAVLSNPGLQEWLLVDGASSTTYVIPRFDTVICGGTAERGRVDLVPDLDVGREIIARARDLVPILADAEVLDHRVGIRPTRSAVRVATQDRDGGGVVHCYGHGGAGVTLSWGCAEEVVAMVGSRFHSGG